MGRVGSLEFYLILLKVMTMITFPDSRVQYPDESKPLPLGRRKS